MGGCFVIQTKGKSLNINFSKAPAQLRQIAAIVGIIISSTNMTNMPSNIREILMAASGAILTAEHLVDGLNGKVATGNAAVASTGQVQAPAAVTPEQPQA